MGHSDTSSAASDFSSNSSQGDKHSKFLGGDDHVVRHHPEHIILFKSPEHGADYANVEHTHIHGWNFKLIPHTEQGTLHLRVNATPPAFHNAAQDNFRVTLWCRDYRGNVTLKKSWCFNGSDLQRSMFDAPEILEIPSQLKLHIYVHVDKEGHPQIHHIRDMEPDRKHLKKRMKKLSKKLKTDNIIDFLCMAYHLESKKYKDKGLHYAAHHYHHLEKHHHHQLEHLDHRIKHDLKHRL